MTTLQATQSKLDALQAEFSTLSKAVEALQAQSAVMDGTLDALYAKAERTGAPAAQQEAAAAEQAKQALDLQIRRKQAALASCAADLETARQALAVATKLAQVDTLESLYTEMVLLAGELDADAFNAGHWRQLNDLTKQAQHIYMRQLRSVQTFATFVPNPLATLDQAYATLRQDIERGDAHGDQPNGISARLDLDKFAQRIGHLRRALTN